MQLLSTTQGMAIITGCENICNGVFDGVLQVRKMQTVDDRDVTRRIDRSEKRLTVAIERCRHYSPGFCILANVPAPSAKRCSEFGGS
eukprot:COSAG02_NODE_22517_length_750_cov_0.717358_2_plen_86_part_01